MSRAWARVCLVSSTPPDMRAISRTLGSPSNATMQVLCVTHLPQVAAQAHRHLQVAKTKRKTDTRTRILALDGEPRVREIARMSGGVELTEQTLAYARDMIQRAQDGSKIKKKLAANGKTKNQLRR